MPRYAVLLDLEDRELRPIALVTEHGDAVRVHFAVECGLRNTYRDSYEVREPDGQTVRYEPGMPEYFDSVLTTLSRAFVVDELEAVDSLDSQELVELYVHRILLRRETRQTAYATGMVTSGTVVVTSSTYPTTYASAYTAELPVTEDWSAQTVWSDDSLLARAA